MATKIITPGNTTHRITCHDCGAVFTYESNDTHTNYVRGGEWVDCPTCRKSCRHMGDWDRQSTGRRT